jgi:hypothetical protein
MDNTTWRKNYLRYKSFFLNTLPHYYQKSDWKAYIEIILSLLTISIFSVFALKPTLLTIAELIRQIDEKKQTLTQINTKISNLTAAQILYDRERENIKVLKENAIPKTIQGDVFAKQIENLSAKYQVKTSLLSLGDTILKSSGYLLLPSKDISQGSNQGLAESNYQIPVLLSIAATSDQYQLLESYLSDLMSLRRPVKIRRLEFTTQTAKNLDKIELILTITGYIPYLP